MKGVLMSGGRQEIVLESMHPSRILRHILEEVDNSKDYNYLVAGQFGPTGKTWLCEGLKRKGYVAIDVNEEMETYVTYRDNENHYYIDPRKKLVIVVLNKRLL